MRRSVPGGTGWGPLAARLRCTHACWTHPGGWALRAHRRLTLGSGGGLESQRGNQRSTGGRRASTGGPLRRCGGSLGARGCRRGLPHLKQILQAVKASRTGDKASVGHGKHNRSGAVPSHDVLAASRLAGAQGLDRRRRGLVAQFTGAWTATRCSSSTHSARHCTQQLCSADPTVTRIKTSKHMQNATCRVVAAALQPFHPFCHGVLPAYPLTGCLSWCSPMQSPVRG